MTDIPEQREQVSSFRKDIEQPSYQQLIIGFVILILNGCLLGIHRFYYKNLKSGLIYLASLFTPFIIAFILFFNIDYLDLSAENTRKIEDYVIKGAIILSGLVFVYGAFESLYWFICDVLKYSKREKSKTAQSDDDEKHMILSAVWYGKRSLAETFWIWNFLIVGIVGGVIGHLLIDTTVKTEIPYLVYFWILLNLIMTAWIAVGLFRSAAHAGGFWGGLVTALVVIGVPLRLYMFALSITGVLRLIG